MPIYRVKTPNGNDFARVRADSQNDVIGAVWNDLLGKQAYPVNAEILELDTNQRSYVVLDFPNKYSIEEEG